MVSFVNYTLYFIHEISGSDFMYKNTDRIRRILGNQMSKIKRQMV